MLFFKYASFNLLINEEIVKSILVSWNLGIIRDCTDTDSYKTIFLHDHKWNAIFLLSKIIFLCSIKVNLSQLLEALK